MKSKHTDEQLAWLRSHLAEYENRAGGNVRGDAKKFALDKAAKYIERWGVPDGEKETTMKEQIYTWFKNTSARGKEARKRHQLMKKAERPPTASAYIAVPNLDPPPHDNASTSQLRYPPPPQPPPPPPQYPPPLSHIPAATHYTAGTSLSPDAAGVRDALLNPTCDANDIATQMQLCMNLSDVMSALFAAAILMTTSAPPDLVDPLQHIVHRYHNAINIWPRVMTFHNYTGPLAGRQLLQHTIRKNAMWVPNTPFQHHPHDMQEELTRITTDRHRKRDHVLWSRIHAVSLELGLIENTWLAETLANDSVWEADEVEWIGGCVLLRGLVRAGKMPTESSTGSWVDLMHSYQSKWKEVRDESRQALMAETLLDIRKVLEGRPHM